MKRKVIISMFMFVILVVLAFGQMDFNTNNGVKLDAGRLSPRLLNYQGFLTDTLGNPITNPSVSMTFGIWSSSGGGTQIWYETQPVSVSKGIFSVLLGTIAPIPDSVFTKSTDRWLELTYAGITLTPRTRIVSAGYAYTSTLADTAANARLLQGKDTTAFDARYVNEGQVNSIFTPMINDTSVTMPKIARAGAAINQIIKWNGSTWAPGSDMSSADNHWSYLITDVADTTLQMGGRWGLARTGNVLYGNADSTHVNFGVACTTGASGQNYKYCTISGGLGNTANDYYATVGGGVRNLASGNNATVGGGWLNAASAVNATVGGGWNNKANAVLATVAGGFGDTASGYYTAVGGGYCNVASDTAATVSGGRYNKARGIYSVVSGGGGSAAADSNSAIGDYSVISGGGRNSASEFATTVGGGYVNTASNYYSTVGGGVNNIASGNTATVSGGTENIASGGIAIVGGGQSNVANGTAATVSGGYANTASNYYTTVSGGFNNVASDTAATVSGGRNNKARGKYSVVSGGGGATAADSNSASGDWSVIGGGRRNKSRNSYATAVGGYGNDAGGDYATVGGGYINVTDTIYATVGGGYSNEAYGYASTISGGYNNSASVIYSTVGGGVLNVADTTYATVGGGYANYAMGYGATVAGGMRDTAAADYSFTVGNNSTVLASYNNSAAFNGQTSTASGQTRVGVLSKVSGTFTIDHPLDPENKILNHYFVESPEMVLIYRGTATIGNEGKATVHLPDYFDALNEEPIIYLTGIGTSDVYLVDNVKENIFTIGGKSGAKVNWMVTGARKDPSAEITKIIMPVEQPKEGGLIGRSLDDEFLVVTKQQLERMDKADGFKFRHLSEQNRYEEMKKMIKESEKK
jgi:hypothetical protein